MKTYHEWNEALARYFLQDAPLGSAIYLQVDPEVLAEAGAQFSGDHSLSTQAWLQNFCRAVRVYVLSGETLHLGHVVRQAVRQKDTEVPLGLSWLCFQVLAAVLMHQNESHNLSNYYVHLRQLLHLSGAGKPHGLDYIDLERLWLQWNRWLSAQGYMPTAKRGTGRTTKYIQYPLSQCLLREGEIQQLQALWAESGLSTRLNRQQLQQWLQQQPDYKFNRRLARLLNSGERPVLSQYIFQLYLSEHWQSASATTQRARVLEAGLYREEDFLTDEITYYPLPQQRGHYAQAPLQVQLNDGYHALQTMRTGWFLPLAEPITDLSKPQHWEVSGAPVSKIVRPTARFWPLVPDPDNPDSGALATWQRPQGEHPFLLLGHRDVMAQVEEAKALQLLSYQRRFKAQGLEDGWFEYLNCQLLPANNGQWQTLKSRAPDLWDALVPVTDDRLLCRGGLRGRAQGRGGWIVGHPPTVGFSGNAEGVFLRLLRDTETQPCWEGLLTDLRAQDWPGPGRYVLQAHVQGETLSERVVYLWDWSELSLPVLEAGFAYVLESGARMQGGVIYDGV